MSDRCEEHGHNWFDADNYDAIRCLDCGLTAGIVSHADQEAAEAKLAALTRDRDALKAGLAKMIAELEAALPAMNTATLIAHVHGQPYSGPTIDLEGAKKTLASTGGA